MNIEELLRNELLEVRRKEVEKTGVLTMLYRLMELLPQKLGVKRTCEDLVRIIMEETDFENCSIALWDAKEKCLSFVAGFGLPELLDEEVSFTYHRDLKFSSGRDVASRVFESCEPIFIEDTKDQPIPRKSSAVVNPACLVCLPLPDLGVINMSASHPRKFSEEKQRNWVLMGSIIGQLISAALMNERLCDANHSLELQVDLKTKALEERNRELLHTNQILEKIIDHVPEGVCLLDANGVLLRINRSMVKFQGEDAAAAIGASPAVFFQDPQTFNDLMAQVSKSEQKLLLDVFMIRPEGKSQQVDVFLARLPDEGGGTKGYILVIYDVTEKKAFSEHLLRTEKLAALGTMAGGVAHDFNNMLMRVLGNTQLLMLHVEDELTRSRLQNIESAVRDAAQTLKRLQTFAGKEGNDNNIAGAVDVNQVIREVVELTRPRWKDSLEKHGYTIDLTLNLAPSCSAHVSPSDLREVVTSIILNAVDAMASGGALQVGTGCDEDHAIIEIHDTGCGMTDDVLRRIFDPFFSTKGVSNSGLGLCVSWNLINRHKGEIQVSSEPGKGSRFRILLPKARNHQKFPAISDNHQELGSRRVLLVDDDEEILRLLRDMIRMSGHRVDATTSGKEALNLIEKEEFDLVFSDMGMPVVSGWEIARKVKEKSPLVPVILVTGWGHQYEEEDLSRQGIDLVLSKPLGYDKLKAILQKYL
ncbi:MAG: response regulator [Deltaproteobacteria bacterium]|jgi:PAS domain S-box-containing protein|nr:response regulator [Deltaproteobacteria bacterium]